jgi:hypothetical protein
VSYGKKESVKMFPGLSSSPKPSLVRLPTVVADKQRHRDAGTISTKLSFRRNCSRLVVWTSTGISIEEARSTCAKALGRADQARETKFERNKSHRHGGACCIPGSSANLSVDRYFWATPQWRVASEVCLR